MITAVIRERLYDYIRVADDKKIEAIYTLLEDQIIPGYHWSENEEFVAELDERVRRYEAGTDPAFSVEKARSSLNEMKKGFLKNLKK
jgi:predicted nuclease with TOPRIM domain